MKRSDYLRHQRAKGKRRRNWWQIILAILILFIIGGLIFVRIPAVATRLQDLRTRITYYLNPPDEAVFIPGQQIEFNTPTAATQTVFAPNPEPEFGGANSAFPTQTAGPTPTTAPDATPIPEVVFLEGVTYVDQHNRWNYCGPANLAMALNYWGWEGNRDDIARVLKPGVDDPDLDFIQRGKTDKNVMPYEMANFAIDEAGMGAIIRVGGEIELLQTLISNGFPVMIEKGYYEADYTGKIAWLGHYLFVTGYDETKGTFTVQDAYLKPGNNIESTYEEFLDGWRSFNYLFMVYYPSDREAEVFNLLGYWADPAWANRHALEMAQSEAASQDGINEFFAWFNIGSSHVRLQEYVDAAFAYDQAFLLYANLESDDTQRPYRIMWYQTGPYWGYYYSGRYQDVINLANTTLNETVAEPTLEESIYWRGLAYWASGNLDGAIADFQQTVYLNPNFIPGWDMLTALGALP